MYVYTHLVMFENFVLTSTVIAFICTPKKHNNMKFKKILQEMQYAKKMGM